MAFGGRSSGRKPKVTEVPLIGKVQYYDSAWGGYRNLDAFGDYPTDTFPRSEALRKARAIAQTCRMDTRVTVDRGPEASEEIIRYRRGSGFRY